MMYDVCVKYDIKNIQIHHFDFMAEPRSRSPPEVRVHHGRGPWRLVLRCGPQAAIWLPGGAWTKNPRPTGDDKNEGVMSCDVMRIIHI